MLMQQTLVHETATTPQLQNVAGVPMRTDVAFTDNSGVEKKAIRTAAEKTLARLGPALQRLLARDEFVVYVCGACAPMGPLEQYTFGYFAQFISKVTLVFTNQRVLAFRVNSDGAWRQSLRACSLGDIRSAKPTGLIVGYLKLEYADGKKESYWALKSRDRAKLKDMLPKLMSAGTPAGNRRAMQSLCPTCGAALIERHYSCAACGQKFRSEESLWWRTFIPGAAYFYAKQTWMGVMHAISDGIIFLYFMLMVAAAFAQSSAHSVSATAARGATAAHGAMSATAAHGAGAAADRTANLWIAVGVFAAILIFERSIALFHARRFLREFIPIDDPAGMSMTATAR